jgi:hypothetical protein
MVCVWVLVLDHQLVLSPGVLLSMSTLIIGDVAGQFDALQSLIQQVPEDKRRTVVLLGDLIDRGPKSAEVIEWARQTPGVVALVGNHEHMMIYALTPDALPPNPYSAQDWSNNGGTQTVQSFQNLYGAGYRLKLIEAAQWLKSRPLYYEEPGLFVSHAPLQGPPDFVRVLKVESPLCLSFLWHRDDPVRREGLLQVFGHEGLEKHYEDWAHCIDHSLAKRVGLQPESELLGLAWPDCQVYRQIY